MAGTDCGFSQSPLAGRVHRSIMWAKPKCLASFEAANPRHEHEWKVWKDVTLRAGKVMMPGLIAHSTNVVEHPDLVAERLLRYADIDPQHEIDDVLDRHVERIS